MLDTGSQDGVKDSVRVTELHHVERLNVGVVFLGSAMEKLEHHAGPPAVLKEGNGHSRQRCDTACLLCTSN